MFKRIVSIILSVLMVLGLFTVISAEDEAVVNGGITIYEDYYKEMPNILAEKGLAVNDNTIDGSDFTVEMAEGHAYQFDNSRGFGLTWWNEEATAGNSGLNFGFPTVNSGILKVTYRFWTGYDGNFGSLISGNLAEHTKVVEVMRADNKIGDAVSNEGENGAVTVQSIVDFESGRYQVKVGDTPALSGTLAEDTEINGVYFDIVEGEKNWGVVENIKVEVADAAKANFVDVTGNLIGSSDIVDGKVTPPAYIAPEGSILLGWKDIYGNIVTDFADATVTGGMIYTAYLDVETFMVTNETELRNALADASTDAENPTVIMLKNDINIATSNGVLLIEGKHIRLTGNYAIIRTGKTSNWAPVIGNGGDGIRAMVVVKNSTVVIEDVAIDVNRVNNEQGGSALYVINGTATLTGNAELRNGGDVKDQAGMAVGLGSNGHFIMEENSKITNFIASSNETSKGNSLIASSYSQSNPKFTMNGGEISGNSTKNYGIIGIRDENMNNTYLSAMNSMEINLNAGKIVDNEWLDEDNYAVYMRSANGGGRIYIGGDMQIEGTVEFRGGNQYPRIKSTLKNPLTIGKDSMSKGKRDDNGNSKSEYYGDILASGTDTYTLTQADINLLSYKDKNIELYIDPKDKLANESTVTTHGRVYAINLGQDYPSESGLIKNNVYFAIFKNENNEQIKSVAVVDGKATAPEYEPAEGYSFKGWAIEGTADIVDFASYTFDQSRTFVPILEYKVTFKTTTGDVEKESYIGIITAPIDTAPEGKEFIGWAIEGLDYVFDFSNAAVPGTIFVPVFKAKYSVIFKDADGNQIGDAVWSNKDLITPPEAPMAPDGMVFKGWTIEGSNDIVDFTKVVNAGTTFVPVYTESKSIKIFTIGHSYGVNANYLLPRVLKEAGYNDITIGMVFAPGCSVGNHYLQREQNAVQYYKNTTGDSTEWKTIKDGVEYPYGGGINSLGDIRTSTLKALQDEEWDIIVMQQSPSQSGLSTSEDYDYLVPLINWVNENKTNPDAKLAWHMTWANEQYSSTGGIAELQGFSGYDKDEAVMYNGIIDAVQTVIIPTGEFDYIIPAGTLIQNMRNSYIGSHFCSDSVHLNDQYGSYPVSMLWAEVLTGVDADTINYIPQLGEYQNTNDVLYLDEKFMDMAHNAITMTLAEPYKVTMDGRQKLTPRMSVDFGEPTMDGNNYKYTATVYLEQYGNLHGIGAVNDKTNQTVTETNNYAGVKIKDWSLNIEFADATDMVSAGTAISSLRAVDSYSDGAEIYTAPDMNVTYNNGVATVSSNIGDSLKNAYPYYGIIKCKDTKRLALGTFEITTSTDCFDVKLSADIQLGNTYANGDFIDTVEKSTYSTSKIGNEKTLIMDTDIMVGQPTVADDPNDGLITSEAELREVLSGNLSTDADNPTKIVLGADIILDDGANTANDLKDGTLTIAGTSDAKVYVDISGNYTIKNMQKIDDVYLINIAYATVNITDTTIDANYGNDNAYAQPGNEKNAMLMSITEEGYVTLNGTATLKNVYGGTAIVVGARNGQSKAAFTMNDNSKLSGYRRNPDKDGTFVVVKGGQNCKFIMNGGEVSGNEFDTYGFLYQDNTSYALVEYNGGKFVNNDTSKSQNLIMIGANTYSNNVLSGNMVFDNTPVRIRQDGKNKPTMLSAPLTFDIRVFSTSNSFESGVATCFVGKNYAMTLSDLQRMSTDAVRPNIHPASRTLALDKATNSVYSYLTIDDVPKGYILADGTVVGEVVIIDSITDVTAADGELTVSYQVNPNKTVMGTPIAAIYKSGNLMYATYDKSANVSLSGENNTGTIKLDAPNDWETNKGDYRIKFFIWNPVTLAPQIDALEYEEE